MGGEEGYVHVSGTLDASGYKAGEIGGDMIPLGIACLAGYLREQGCGVGVLDCPTLRIDADKVYEIFQSLMVMIATHQVAVIPRTSFPYTAGLK